MEKKQPINRIFHPTDLSGSSHTAFIHALRLAMSFRASLTMLHMGHREQAWAEMPHVRLTLKRWGVLKDDGSDEEFKALGFGIRKVVAKGSDPFEACAEYLEQHPTDLLVMATHQGSSGFNPMQQQVAAPLARSEGQAALFLPHHQPGFVDPKTGQLGLRRILIPIAKEPDPAAAIRAAVLLADRLELSDVSCTVLHIGTNATMPDPMLPEDGGCSWEQVVKQGDVVDTILAMHEEIKADLIVMATEGHDGFLDALRGNTTERVLQKISCPLLAWRA